MTMIDLIINSEHYCKYNNILLMIKQFNDNFKKDNSQIKIQNNIDSYPKQWGE